MDSGVAPGARVEEVIAFRGRYTKVDLYFVTSATIEKVELGILIRASCIEVAVASVIVCQSPEESEQAEAVRGKRTEVEKVFVPWKDLELQSSHNEDETV